MRFRPIQPRVSIRRNTLMLIMNSGSDSNAAPSTPIERKNMRSTRQRVVDSNTNKFLRDFDPQRSEREKRKLHRRLYPGSKKHVIYDETGCLIKTGSNLCDCLQADCPGCHFPCSKCGSTKCGHECRIHRKWTYDSIENEGSDIVMKNPSINES